MSVHLLNEMVSDDFDGFVEGSVLGPGFFLSLLRGRVRKLLFNN
jgi:hypothetical protein